MPAFIKTSNNITISFDDGETSTVYSNESHYDDVVEAVKNEEWERAYELTRPVVAFTKKYTSEHVTIDNGVVLLDGQQMHGTLVDRMVEMHKEGFDMKPLSNFLVRLNKNPSKRAVDELYGFLEASGLPITSDGHFLAYKRVRADYKDIYTGTIDNSIGQVVEMSRNHVDDEKTRTCSSGLHFCARGYLKHYGVSRGNTTVIVKIDPADVVSIPVDYNNAKGRCCKYIVVGELVHTEEEELELRAVDDRWDDNDWNEPEFEEDFEDNDVDESSVDPLNWEDRVFSNRQELRDFLALYPNYRYWDRGANVKERWVAKKIK